VSQQNLKLLFKIYSYSYSHFSISYKDKIITREKIIPIYQEEENCESIVMPVVKRGGSNLKKKCHQKSVDQPCRSSFTFDRPIEYVK
jgi:hypothetical protein